MPLKRRSTSKNCIAEFARSAWSRQNTRRFLAILLILLKLIYFRLPGQLAKHASDVDFRVSVRRIAREREGSAFCTVVLISLYPFSNGRASNSATISCGRVVLAASVSLNAISETCIAHQMGYVELTRCSRASTYLAMSGWFRFNEARSRTGESMNLYVV